MSETSGDDDRIHSEAPAEGDTAADPADIRVHAEEPAEGADSEDQGSDGT
ncbi:hypothetical protein [Arthrobacter antioxidans]|nr:hypothetical protein [Arthrobacter antioxidans]